MEKSLTVVTVKNKRTTIIYLFHIFPFFFGQTQTSSLFVYLLFIYLVRFISFESLMSF